MNFRFYTNHLTETSHISHEECELLFCVTAHKAQPNPLIKSSSKATELEVREANFKTMTLDSEVLPHGCKFQMELFE